VTDERAVTEFIRLRSGKRLVCASIDRGISKGQKGEELAEMETRGRCVVAVLR